CGISAEIAGRQGGENARADSRDQGNAHELTISIDPCERGKVILTPLRKLVCLCLVGSCLAASASDADTEVTLSADIGPRPLAEALTVFGRQTGLQLIYVSEVAEALP